MAPENRRSRAPRGCLDHVGHEGGLGSVLDQVGCGRAPWPCPSSSNVCSPSPSARGWPLYARDSGPRAKVQRSNVAKTGAWSWASPTRAVTHGPRLEWPAFELSGVAQTWSRRRPLSAASQSRRAIGHQLGRQTPRDMSCRVMWTQFGPPAGWGPCARPRSALAHDLQKRLVRQDVLSSRGAMFRFRPRGLIYLAPVGADQSRSR